MGRGEGSGLKSVMQLMDYPLTGTVQNRPDCQKATTADDRAGRPWFIRVSYGIAFIGLLDEKILSFSD